MLTILTKKFDENIAIGRQVFLYFLFKLKNFLEREARTILTRIFRNFLFNLK